MKCMRHPSFATQLFSIRPISVATHPQFDVMVIQKPCVFFSFSFSFFRYFFLLNIILFMFRRNRRKSIFLFFFLNFFLGVSNIQIFFRRNIINSKTLLFFFYNFFLFKNLIHMIHLVLIRMSRMLWTDKCENIEKRSIYSL